ncbi:hypothetical protein HG530_000157 [Fusarium avenaceum]|nr:hypothetical protein HG530_000157 [Fusarium avenaceum]
MLVEAFSQVWPHAAHAGHGGHAALSVPSALLVLSAPSALSAPLTVWLQLEPFVVAARQPLSVFSPCGDGPFHVVHVVVHVHNLDEDALPYEGEEQVPRQRSLR